MQSERAAALFDSFLVDHQPPDRISIQNYANPPLGRRLVDYTKRPIILCRAGVSVDDLISNSNKTGALGPVAARIRPLEALRAE